MLKICSSLSLWIYQVVNTPGRCSVPVCTCRWWFLADGSAWGSWSRWRSPGPCPPPFSSCGHQGVDAPAASRPAQQTHVVIVCYKGFKMVSKVGIWLHFKKHHQHLYICLPRSLTSNVSVMIDAPKEEAGAATPLFASYTFRRKHITRFKFLLHLLNSPIRMEWKKLKNVMVL